LRAARQLVNYAIPQVKARLRSLTRTLLSDDGLVGADIDNSVSRDRARDYHDLLVSAACSRLKGCERGNCDGRSTRPSCSAVNPKHVEVSARYDVN